jgi:hypothetical protein
VKKLLCKLACLVGVALSVAVPAKAEFFELEKLWEILPSDYPGILGSDGSHNTDRGMAYNPTTGHLLVVTRLGGPQIRLFLAKDGSPVLTEGGSPRLLSLTGVTGGTFLLNKVTVAEDGTIYAANLQVDTAGGDLKVYRWANEQAEPEVVFAGRPLSTHATAGQRRFGDSIAVRGIGADTRILLAPWAGTHVVVLRPEGGSQYAHYEINLPWFTPEGSTTLQQARNLSFGPGNLVYGSHPGNAAFELAFDGDATPPTLQILRTFTGAHLPIRIGPLAYGAPEDIIAGLWTSSSGTAGQHSVYVYRRTHLSTQWTVTELDVFPFNFGAPNGNGTGDVVVVGDKIYALATNNGILALQLNEVEPPPPPPPPPAGANFWTTVNAVRTTDDQGAAASVRTGLASAVGIDLDPVSERIFYADNAGGVVASMRYDGSDHSILATGTNPQYLGVHNGRVYWTQFAQGLFSANIDGSDLQHLVVLENRTTSALSIDGQRGYVYFASANHNLDGVVGAGALYRVGLNGENLTPLTNLPTQTYGMTVDSVTNTLYGTSFTGNSIYTIDLNNPTNPPVVLISTGLVQPLGISLNNERTHLIWAERNNSSAASPVGLIRRAPLDTLVVETLQSAEAAPFGVAVMPDAPVVSEGFASWIADQGVPAGQRGPQDDPDGDGVANLLEYALGGNPAVANRDILPVQGTETVNGQTYLSIAFTKNASASDVSLIVETSGDLITWNSGTGHTVVVEETASAAIVRDAVALTDANRRFIRLRVEQD